MQASDGSVLGKEIVAVQRGSVIPSGRSKCGLATGPSTAGMWYRFPPAETRAKPLPETQNDVRRPICSCWKSSS